MSRSPVALGLVICCSLLAANAATLSPPLNQVQPETPANPALPDTVKVAIVRPDTIRVRLPDKRFPDPAWGLVGVLIGAAIGEGPRRWQDHRRIDRLKKALRDECR